MALRHPPPETWIDYNITNFTACVKDNIEIFIKIFPPISPSKSVDFAAKLVLVCKNR
jgi:hypothetical protein